ncbi:MULTISPECIES: MmcQ/YjbR family DNA-binding protein [unclassified Mucilaginibacter]|uniref:MmcQ/YjbR family DNA-binding protein n=1 Tax=unclassified Mucilaginibacter TaxID=2617802 RepID=UPI0009654B8E|nr:MULTISPECIES: MmcQ/YjbR family DNA-binding protein [unclassified Mucilaginibacter]OJW17180.1 MAG: MmcQ-like protein [Mucilaginibacter sp. 44-25]PLW89269.1 MAG: MmcQ-like protein [Mucilaginibacter sp.]HEK19199.1 MmcQ/YjbR family DNA-binding protein [Bacteroidota bacterium]
MHIEDLRDYCLAKPGVTESFPFGEDILVFKVGDKVFLLTGLNDHSFNVKCDPEKAIELREQFSEVMPGFHMNKKHWNTVRTDGSLTNKQLKEMIDHSYELVFAALPKKVREEIATL